MNSSQSGNESEELSLRASSPACLVQVEKITAFVDQNLEPVLLPVHIGLCVLSAVVCAVNLSVLSRPSMRTCSLNVLLASLEGVNLVVSFLFLYNSVVLHAFPSSLIHREHAFVQILLLSVAWSAVAITVWLTAIIGTWRFIAVVRPLRARELLTRQRAVYVVVILAFLCFVGFSVHTFMSFKMKTWQHVLCSEDDFDPSASYMYSIGKRRWFYECVLIGFVFLVLPALYSVVTTCCLVCTLVSSLRERRRLVGTQKKDSGVKTTFILTLLLFGTLVCNASPYLSDMLLWNAWKLTLPYPWKYVMDEYVLGLAMNVLSFTAYYHMGTRFRETFLAGLAKTAPCLDTLKTVPHFVARGRSRVWHICKPDWAAETGKFLGLNFLRPATGTDKKTRKEAFLAKTVIAGSEMPV